MTKKRTYTGTGSSHFVTFSTYGRRSLLSTAFARDIVIAELNRLAGKDLVRVAGFVIMPDHVHALLWFNDERGLPGAMNSWKSSSARALKKFYACEMPKMLEHLTKVRDGRARTSFWQTRYYDFNVQGPEKAREKIDYMHENPVKRGLCLSPAEWRWSSYRWYYLREDVGVKITPGL